MSTSTYAYAQRWRAERAQGVLRIVDATDAQNRLHTLTGAGWSARAIAAAAGISVQCVSRVLAGQERANRATVAAILTVDPLTVPSAASNQTTEPFVPRIGSVRRIQALLAMGWPHSALQARSGARTSVLLAQQGRWVTRTTHDRIAALYDQLAMTAGPSSLTRDRARKLGYALPLQWDDIDHDQTPVAPSAADRPPTTLRGVDRVGVVEDLTFLADHAVGATEAARRVGLATRVNLDKYLRRGGPADVVLLNRLLAQDPIPLTTSRKTWGRVA